MLKEENFEEESKESSVQFSSATYLLEEKKLKKKEEKNKENTEESLESVPMSPLDPNWGERIPLHTHVGALGGCCDRPVCSSAEEILYYFLSLIHHPTRELNLILMFIAE